MSARPGVRTAYLVVALFTVLAGDAWRYSLSWYGWGVIAVALTAIAVTVLVRTRREWIGAGLPIPLLGFLALALLSIAWSYYRGASALGVLGTLATTAVALSIALSYDWREILRGLGLALRIILAGSLLFELVVSVIVRRPILPFWVDYGDLDPIPKLLLWSRNELFDVLGGGRIQGIVGNASTLGFMALLAAIVFAVQLAARTVRAPVAIAWLAVAGIVTLLTRSATITVAIVVVALVAAAALLVRALRPRAKLIASVALVVAGAAAVALAVVFRDPLLALLGKSSDLTNRLDIWEAVIGLAQQRPVAGWGWVSYWVPWVPPFDDLLKVNGVQVMHAHNAWLDVWLQLGIIGLVVFGALVVSTWVRAWSRAVDRPLLDHGVPARFGALELLPILLLTALLVQSLAESRLLVEYGWTLLVIVAVKTRSDRLDPVPR